MFLAKVAAPGGIGGTPPEHKDFRAERMRIDCRKNLKFSLKFSKFFKNGGGLAPPPPSLQVGNPMFPTLTDNFTLINADMYTNYW